MRRAVCSDLCPRGVIGLVVLGLRGWLVLGVGGFGTVSGLCWEAESVVCVVAVTGCLSVLCVVRFGCRVV